MERLNGQFPSPRLIALTLPRDVDFTCVAAFQCSEYPLGDWKRKKKKKRNFSSSLFQPTVALTIYQLHTHIY